MVSFSPEHVLVCQAHMHRLMGSEVATLEVIDYFLSKNIRVTLLTCAVGEPVLSQIRERTALTSIQVNIDDVDTYLSDHRPDLVWVHHGVLPSVLLENIGNNTKFVFNHMSAHLSIEYPVSYPIEPLISDLSLFNAQKIKDVHIETGLYSTMPAENLQLFENPVPDSFLAVERSQEPFQKKRIGIISNHIPAELLQAIAELSKTFDIELVGIQREYGATPQAVSPAFLNNFDAVITIGKTVQYSLVSGIPVYCYDHFGGPGWLTSDNLSEARFDNFSGRGFSRKSAEELISELNKLSSVSTGDIKALRNIATKEFLMSSRMEQILNHLGKAKISAPELDRGLIVANKFRLSSFAIYVQEWVRSLQEVENLTERLNHNQKELSRAHSALDKIKKYSGVKLIKNLFS